MTLSEHLGELRHRLVICVIALPSVAAGVPSFAYEPILHFLLRPLCNVDASTGHNKSSTGSFSSVPTGPATSS